MTNPFSIILNLEFQFIHVTIFKELLNYRKTSLDSPHHTDSNIDGRSFVRYSSYDKDRSQGPSNRSSGRSFGHRRTPSGSSSATFRLVGGNPTSNSQEAIDGDIDYYSALGGSSGECSIGQAPLTPSSRRSRSHHNQHYQSQQPVSMGIGPEVERPQTLELPLTPRTPMRSSLKKNSSYPLYQQQMSLNNSGGTSVAGNTQGQSRWSHQGGTSSGGTPTNPTPPDSISEDVFLSGTGGGSGGLRSDSGFVSSASGGERGNRVRFSPSPFETGSSAIITSTSGGHILMTDWSPTHVDPLPLRNSTVAPDPTTKSQPHISSQRGKSRSNHYISESDLQRDFNIFP